jgi:hypothetical protein
MMQFFLLPVTSFLLGSNILLSIRFSNILNLCYSLNVRDQVSHPYKTAGKTVVLYILILTFDWKTDSRLHGSKRSLN